MNEIDWLVEGLEFGCCNCAYGCPCQFEQWPTNGDCRGFEAVRIERGHFGDVPLEGLTIVMLYAWPGPIFEGKGEIQPIIDARASDAQRAALAKILLGEETDEGATHWWVYRAMSETVYETLYESIEFDVDLDARRGHVRIPGVLESTGRPIISPATGQEHRVRIDIPNGIEFEQAEIGSASVNATGTIALNLSDTYGQFNRLRHSRHGVVHS
jgi:hypothetical protein